MKIPQDKKEFLQSADPLTLFCFVDFTSDESVYRLVHPKDEDVERNAALAENPERVYLYIRNQSARDYVGVYGNAMQTVHVTS